MTKKEEEFERIARQAREFREQELNRIAAEKVEAEQRIQYQKQLELDRVAQVTSTFLEQAALKREQQQQQQQQQKYSDIKGIESPSSSVASSSYHLHHHHHHGVVAEEAARLQKRQEEVEKRRLEEEEFRKLHPHLEEDEFRKHHYQHYQHQQHLESGGATATTTAGATITESNSTQRDYESILRRIDIRERIELHNRNSNNNNKNSNNERVEDEFSHEGGKLPPGVQDLLSRMDGVSHQHQPQSQATIDMTVKGDADDNTDNDCDDDNERTIESNSTTRIVHHRVEKAEVQLHRYEKELEVQYRIVDDDLQEVDRALHHHHDHHGDHSPDPDQPQPITTTATATTVDYPDDEISVVGDDLKSNVVLYSQQQQQDKQAAVSLLEEEARMSRIETLVYEAELQLHRNEVELEAQFMKLDKELQEADASLHRTSAIDGSSEAKSVHVITTSFEETGITEFDLELEAEVQESLERTRAMLAEDDLIPSRRNNTDIYGTTDKLHSRRHNKEGMLVVRTVLSPVKPSAGRTPKGHDKNEREMKDIVHREASFEVPIEITTDGLKFSPNVADLSMMTTIPASRLGGRWSGTLEGNSNLGSFNTASGRASVEYKASKYSRFTVGMIRGCEAQHPLLTVGGRLQRYGSSLGVTLYHSSAMMRKTIVGRSMWSLSYRYAFQNTKWALSSQLSRHNDMTVSLTNSKLSGRIGWNWHKTGKFHVRVDARPRLSTYRRAHVYCQWRTGIWQFGVSIVQSLHSQVSTVGLGWRLLSTKGFEWVISWNRGNGTVRVPITISKGLTGASFGQVMYISMISYIVQDCLAELWGWIGDNVVSSSSSSSESSSATATKSVHGGGMYKQLVAKAKRDAAIQRELMTRQARRKEKEETVKDGLVIVEGLYFVQGGDKWDVTLPLQFWVSRSTLSLPGRSKSELLGFYDVTTSLKKNENTRMATVGLPSFSWSDVWNDLFDWTSKGTKSKQDTKPIPKLTILYKMKGQLYRITIDDCSELKLPDHRAEQVVVQLKDSSLSPQQNKITIVTEIN
jgi:hypothetical protein